MNKRPITIYISGAPSPTTVCPPAALEQGKTLGEYLGGKGITVTSTATTGFPMWVALAAHRQGSTTLAFSPAASEHEHENVYQYKRDGYTSIIYTGFGTSGASVMGVRSSDAVIFGCGGMTSVLELMTAVGEHKPIGVLQGSWGADEVLIEMISTHYPDYQYITMHEDPIELAAIVSKQVAYLRTQE